MIDGITVTVDADAVVVRASAPLAVVSSAPVGGGVSPARTIVNLHVAKDFVHRELGALIHDFAQPRGLPAPWVGFLTAARTERAEVAVERVDDVVALAVVTVGLSRPISVVRAAPAPATPVGTINAVVVLDADLDDAALVNVLATVSEVKAVLLGAASVRCDDGAPATGTATDAIAVAATARGPRHAFGGPSTVPGAAAARAAHRALDRGIARWLEAHR